MRHRQAILALTLSLGLAACVATPAGATQQGAVLGAAGEIYLVKSGTYGQLFPNGKELSGTDRSNYVLSLDVVRPDGSLERSLVPGTEGAQAERLPFLQYEELSNTVFLVWETRISLIHPVLMLSGYNGDWIEPIEIIGNPFAPKTSPQLAVTRETLQEVAADGSPLTRHTTVLHLVFGEEVGYGPPETFYVPVVLEDGIPTAPGKVFKLNDLDTSEAAPGEVSANLQQALAIRKGRDERTVVVAFPSPRSHRLVTIEIDSLPPQISQLADGARSHIVDIGARMSLPGDLKKLADDARSHIVDIGRAFHPEVARAIADDVFSYILTEGPGKGLKVIADGARSHIVDIGVKLSGRGLRSSTSASVASSQVLEIAPTADFSPLAEGQPISRLFNVRVVSDRPAPEVGEGEIMLFVSESGEEALLAWVKIDRLFYRESSGTGWREPLQLRLSETLDLVKAAEILQQRIQNR